MTQMMLKMTMALGIAALAAQSLVAQTRNSGPREGVVRKLAETYGESRRGMGLVRQGSVMEVFASDETGSWTIVVTMPNGTSCMLASGQSHETLAEALPAPGSDA